jgi:hypothetical protein
MLYLNFVAETEMLHVNFVPFNFVTVHVNVVSYEFEIINFFTNLLGWKEKHALLTRRSQSPLGQQSSVHGNQKEGKAFCRTEKNCFKDFHRKQDDKVFWNNPNPTNQSHI